jgi:hypothetical protein
MTMTRVGWALLAVAVVGAVEAEAQWTQVDDAWCEGRSGRDDERFCMSLEGDFDAEQHVTVDGGQNGGVQVEGWSQDRVSVRAKIWANAQSPDRARELAADVRVTFRNGRLSADGPDTGRRESWGVSWEVMVPTDTDLDVETLNGGISVTEVRGEIDFRAQNGGVHLNGVAGDVSGRTTNGGVHVELDGRRWDGAGLDVETTNGGVTLAVPSDYSARLETGTVNGGMSLDFPVTVQGRVGKRLSTTLGEGGPTVRAMTTNGGVRVVRAGNAIR